MGEWRLNQLEAAEDADWLSDRQSTSPGSPASAKVKLVFPHTRVIKGTPAPTRPRVHAAEKQKTRPLDFVWGPRSCHLRM